MTPNPEDLPKMYRLRIFYFPNPKSTKCTGKDDFLCAVKSVDEIRETMLSTAHECIAECPNGMSQKVIAHAVEIE